MAYPYQQKFESFITPSFCPRCKIRLKKVAKLKQTYECPRCGLRFIKAWDRRKI